MIKWNNKPRIGWIEILILLIPFFLFGVSCLICRMIPHIQIYI